METLDITDYELIQTCDIGLVDFRQGNQNIPKKLVVRANTETNNRKISVKILESSVYKRRLTK